MENNFYTREDISICADKARDMLKDISTYTVIADVRRPDEFAVKHIKGAINIPLGQLKEKAKELLPDKNQEIILYCQSGNRSCDAAKVMQSMGYTNVYDLGAIDKWIWEFENSL